VLSSAGGPTLPLLRRHKLNARYLSDEGFSYRFRPQPRSLMYTVLVPSCRYWNISFFHQQYLRFEVLQVRMTRHLAINAVHCIADI
jgi:hypothetical protein